MIFWKSVTDYVSELLGQPVDGDDDSPLMMSAGIGELPEKLAAAVLGLTATLVRLGELGEEVDQLISGRTEEVARKQSQQQRERRKDSEQAWRRFVLMLNAAAVMDPDEHRYERFVKLMNYLLKEQKRQMHHIRKKHPRKRETKNLG